MARHRASTLLERSEKRTQKEDRKSLKKEAQDRVSQKRQEKVQISRLDPVLMAQIYGPDWETLLGEDEPVVDFDLDLPSGYADVRG